jgi:hypothetical protein
VHIAEALLFAAAAGLANVTFYETDLSTLAESVQQGVLRLLVAKLRAGGVLHISSYIARLAERPGAAAIAVRDAALRKEP